MSKTYELTHNDLIEKYLLTRIKNNTKNDKIREILEYHFGSGGSRTRAKLTFYFSKRLGLNDEVCFLAACIPEFFHNASLIHDDLQDGDEYRRNKMAVWRKFGSDFAICAGDFLINEAYSCLADLPENLLSQKLIKHISENISLLINGQMKDLAQDKLQTLKDLKTYEEIASSKSAPLLGMTLTIPLIFLGKIEIVQIAEKIFKFYAIAYQIKDDLVDIENDQSKKGLFSGVNIITVLQMAKDNSPYKSALKIGKERLKKAKELCMKVPKECQEILLTEILKLEKKFEESF